MSRLHNRSVRLTTHRDYREWLQKAAAVWRSDAPPRCSHSQSRQGRPRSRRPGPVHAERRKEEAQSTPIDHNVLLHSRWLYCRKTVPATPIRTSSAPVGEPLFLFKAQMQLGTRGCSLHSTEVLKGECHLLQSWQKLQVEVLGAGQGTLDGTGCYV